MASVPEPKNLIYGLFCFGACCGDLPVIRYVGQTSRGVRVRLASHKGSLRHDVARGKRLTHGQRWMLKHGCNNINIEVLEAVRDPKDLDAREAHWIAQFENLTNVRPGGLSSRGWKMPVDSLMTGARNPMFGKDRRELMAYASSFQVPATEETRRRMSLAQTGRTHTVETKKKMSEYRSGWWTAGQRKAASERGKGVGNSNAKLNDDLVRSIRERNALGESYYSIARTLGLCDNTVANACQRKTWKHVT